MVQTELVEISATPQNDLFWVGWSKFSWYAPNGFQSSRKKVLVLPNSFLDHIGPPESKTAEIRPKKAVLQKFLHPQNRPFWGGVVEIFSARTK